MRQDLGGHRLAGAAGAGEQRGQAEAAGIARAEPPALQHGDAVAHVGGDLAQGAGLCLGQHQTVPVRFRLDAAGQLLQRPAGVSAADLPGGAAEVTGGGIPQGEGGGDRTDRRGVQFELVGDGVEGAVHVSGERPDAVGPLQSLGTAPQPEFTYPQMNAASIVPTPISVTAGTDTLMVISGVNTHFADGQTVVGFGSSDISVRGSWVVNPTMVILNLSVDPAAQPGITYVTVATGLEIITLPDLFTVVAAAPIKSVCGCRF